MISGGIRLNRNTSLHMSNTNISHAPLITSTQPVFFIVEGHQVTPAGISTGKPDLTVTNYLPVFHTFGN